MLFLLTDFPQKLKLEKVHGALIILFYISPSSPPLQHRFEENAKILSKNSTTQENITISRQNLLFLLKTQKTTTLQQVTGGKVPNLVLKRRLQNLYKKENFKPEIKLMIENLQDELYQLENKQAKGAKLIANIR